MVTANKKQIYIVTPTSITESSDVRSEDTGLKYISVYSQYFTSPDNLFFYIP